MNQLHPLIARALSAFAPPSPVAHQIVSEDQALRIDTAMLRDKQTQGYDRRNDSAALRLQIERTTQTGEVR